MFVRWVKIKDNSNLVAEAKEIREGLIFCRENGISNVIMARRISELN